MQVFKKILALTLACTLALSMGAVSVLAANETGSGGSGISGVVTISPATLALKLGETTTGQLTATGVSGVVTWASSAASVATVSDSGLVTAVAAGTADITAKIGEVTSAPCKVTVTAADLTDQEKVAAEAAKITGITAPAKDAVKLTLPTVGAGFTVAITSSDKLGVIALDGTIVPPDTEITVALVLTVTYTGKNVTADTASINVVVPAKTGVDEKPDYTDLNAAIKKATDLKKADEIAEDGSTVATDKTWVTKAVNDALIKAQEEAAAALKATKQADIDAATKALVAAMDAYKPVNGTKKPAEELKFADLEAAIAAAKKVTKADVIAENGSIVATDRTWVTKAVSDAFTKALADAEAALKATKQADIDAAAKALVAATKAYVPAKGTKTEGGGSSGGNGGAIGGGSNNTANAPETAEKVKDTVEALKDPTLKLPADAAKTVTAGGATVTTIPVTMTSGNANVGMDMIKTLGDAPANVGIKFTVKSGMSGDSMEIVVPGGFGKITEPGRISYSMDYADKAASNDDMLKAVKGEGVTSTTAKIGGNQTLPVTATITVSTKVANGTTVNIYKYDPLTKKFIVVGKAVAKNGKLTFGTKIMGEMLFTTGEV